MGLGKRFVSLVVCSVLLAYSATPLLAGAAAQRGSAPAAPQEISAAGVQTAAPAEAGGSETNILIVKYRSGVSARERASALDEVQALSLPLDAGDPRIELAAAPEGVDRQQVLADLNANPDVEYAEYDRVMEPLAFLLPSDPDFADSDYLRLNSIDYYPYGRSWHLRKTGAVEAWGLAIDDDSYHPLQALPEAVQVAVIDTGVHLDHPDFDGRVKAGYDFFESYDGGTAQFVTDADVTPVPREQYSSSGHGTGVAGVMAAAANNGVGSVGTGFDVEVVAYKTAGPVYNLTGYADGTTLILGAAVQASIRHAADNGVKVINLSLGSPRFSQAEADAVAYAQSKGCIVVAATGNNSGALYYPAALPDVVSVGAVRASGGSATELGQMVRAESSNFGPEIDIVAPGYAVWAPTTPGYDYDGSGATYQPGYNWWFGTSLAAPQVSAALALLWRAAPSSQGSTVVDALLTHGTEDMGDPGFDVYTGHGLLDINSAYRGLTRPVPTTSTPTTYESAVEVSWDASPNAIRYEYRLNDGSALSSPNPAVTVAELPIGTSTIDVRAVGATQGASAWAPLSVTRNPLAAPSVSLSTAVTLTGSIEATITPVVGALAYEARLTPGDSGGVATTWTLDGDVAKLKDIPPGENVLEFRAVNNTVQSDWTRFDVQHVALGPTVVTADDSEVQHSSALISWVAVPGAEWYDVRVGAGPPMPTSSDATSTAINGLMMGQNKIYVRARAANTYGPWATTDVTYQLATPVVTPQSSAVTTSTVSLSWTDVPNADVYEYQLVGSAPVLTAETTGIVNGLVHGANTIQVRAVNEDGNGPWGTATVEFLPPAAPIISASTVVNQDRVTAYWAADPRAVKYEYQLNDVGSQETTETSALLTGLTPGVNTIRVRAFDTHGPGPWSSRTVTFTAPTKITLVTPSFRFNSSTKLSGKLTDWEGKPLQNRKVLIERSINGGETWPDVTTVTTSTGGTWTYTYNPSSKYERNQRIRVRFHGEAGVYAKSSAERALSALVYLSTPKTSVASPRAGRSFSVTSSLKPRFKAGTYPVKLLIYKKQKDGSYKYVQSSKARASNYSTYTRLTAKVAIKHGKGSYRMRMRYDGSSKYAKSYSSYRYVTVR